MSFEIYTDVNTLKAPVQFHISNPQGYATAWSTFKYTESTDTVYVAHKLNTDQLYIDEFSLAPLHIKGRFAYSVRDYGKAWKIIRIYNGSFNFE